MKWIDRETRIEWAYTVNDNEASIGKSAFRSCSGLTSVTIPSSVTSIGDDAFDGCGNLRTVCVDKGDADRVKKMIRDSVLTESSVDITKLQFVEIGKEEMK